MHSILKENDRDYPDSLTADQIAHSGNLSVPEGARGVVLFAHGSSTSLHSPYNRYFAQLLYQAKFATDLMDLLTPEEEATNLRTKHLRCDIDLLATRLISATDSLRQNPRTCNLKVGYFGCGIGSAAAMVAAAARPDAVGAIVSRGGRPDLAGEAVSRVLAATLLIVGENNLPMIARNRRVLARFFTQKQLEIIPRATHLFEDPGTLKEVARLSIQWFQRYLTENSGC
ncbi:MAG: alpha/beta hydrolase [Merismopedia sp. SIO2A8]|nr:alpha/beta hydrolase [Symploca sp. SIO2B6]NET51446.1 alpha/beta hydrolase [Merismopedia sp. SIO2A8]